MIEEKQFQKRNVSYQCSKIAATPKWFLVQLTLFITEGLEMGVKDKKDLFFCSQSLGDLNVVFVSWLLAQD